MWDRDSGASNGDAASDYPTLNKEHIGQSIVVGLAFPQSVVLGLVRPAPAKIVPRAAGAEIIGPLQGPRASTAEALMSTYVNVNDRAAIPIVTTVSSDDKLSEAEMDGMRTPRIVKPKRQRLQSEIGHARDMFDHHGDELPDGWELGRSPPPA